MTNGIGLFVGAFVFAAGGSVGWWLRPAEAAPASARTDAASSRAVLDELAALRGELRALAARGELAPLDRAERAPAIARPAVDETALLRRIEELLEGRVTPRGAAAGAGALEPAKATDEELASLASIARGFEEHERRAEDASSAEASVPFSDRLRATFKFQTLDDVLARFGRPHEVSGDDGSLMLHYNWKQAPDVERSLWFQVAEGRVVDIDIDD